MLNKRDSKKIPALGNKACPSMSQNNRSKTKSCLNYNLPCDNNPMKVFWLFNHPAPYKVDFFNVLGKECEIHAVFERKTEAGRNATFYNKEPENYTQTICNSLPLGGINNWTRKPLGILKKGNFDIVVINGWRTFSEQHVIDYCKNHRIPYVFYINGGIIPEKEAKWKFKMKRRYISGAHAYMCPDESSKQYLIHYGADEKRIFFYPYSTIFDSSIATTQYTYAHRCRLREKEGYPFPHLFISSGQFIARKNFEQLIRAWKELPENYGLLITGEGPLKEQYEEQIKTLGLGKRVILSPYLEHEKLLETFRYCDGFVFTSKQDIYGHVINEALSQGLPVVSSDQVNAAKHLIRDGQNGFVITLDQDESIVQAVLNIKEDMRQEAIKTAKENTIERSAQYHLDFFKAILEARK